MKNGRVLGVENKKCLNLIRGGGGGRNFQKCLKFKKSEISDGGEVTPIWEFSSIFFAF